MRKTTIGLVFLTVLLQASVWANEAVETGNKILILLDSAKEESSEQKWTDAQQNLQAISDLWKAQTESSQNAQNVSKALREAEDVFAQKPTDASKLAAWGELATKSLIELDEAADVYVDSLEGKKKQDPSVVQGFKNLVENSAKQTPTWSTETARTEVKEITERWSAVESAVRNQSSDAYSSVETQLSLLRVASNKTPADLETIQKSLTEMSSILAPLGTVEHYGAWDAAFVLFREGLEALLVLAALLAFLKRSGQSNRKVWVWSGAGSGLAVSVVAAFSISTVLGAVAASGAREATEGYVGIVSVLLMLTVGYWLHTKSNIQKWNASIKKQMGKALEAGSLISLALVSFVAVVREGAESIIFLLSMATSMSWVELTIGLSSALVALIVLGVVLIKFSAKLPLGSFFTTATILIHYLAFKILGESIHALQAAGIVGAHEWTGFPSVPFFGIYPTWEGLIPQAVLLTILAVQWILTETKKQRDKAAANATASNASKPIGAAE